MAYGKINYLSLVCSCANSGIFLQYSFCIAPTCGRGRQRPGTGRQMLSILQLKKIQKTKVNSSRCYCAFQYHADSKIQSLSNKCSFATANQMVGGSSKLPPTAERA